ncbi:MAG: MATE family efflux transporter, partial [Synergistes sp.]|nr:MATE family efflux transporter [Synergistes sp.]
VIQSSINSFGAVVMAGNAAAANVDVFIYFAMNAFYQAIISFTSQNFGAGRIKRIFQVLGRGLACIAAIGTVLGLLAVYNGRLLLGIYTSSPAVIDAGMIRLWFVAAPYAICGLMDGMVGVLRGLGYSTLPTIVSFVGVCCLRLVWLAAIFNVGFLRTIEMVYISYPATWIITFFAHLFCFRYIMKKRFHI